MNHRWHSNFLLLHWIQIVALVVIVTVGPGCATTGTLLGHYQIPKTTHRIGILTLEVYDGVRPFKPENAYGRTQYFLTFEYPVFRIARIGRRYREIFYNGYDKTDILERVSESVSEMFVKKGVQAEILNNRENADPMFGTSISDTVKRLSHEGKLDAVLFIHLEVIPGVSPYSHPSEYATYRSYWTDRASYQSSGVTLWADCFFYDLTKQKELYSWLDEVRVLRRPTISQDAVHRYAVSELSLLLEKRLRFDGKLVAERREN